MVTLNVSVPDAVHDWIKSQVESGFYADASDYVSDLIGHDREAKQRLIQALEEGEHSGISDKTIRDVMAEGKERLRNAKD